MNTVEHYVHFSPQGLASKRPKSFLLWNVSWPISYCISNVIIGTCRILEALVIIFLTAQMFKPRSNFILFPKASQDLKISIWIDRTKARIIWKSELIYIIFMPKNRLYELKLGRYHHYMVKNEFAKFQENLCAGSLDLKNRVNERNTRVPFLH